MQKRRTVQCTIAIIALASTLGNPPDGNLPLGACPKNATRNPAEGNPPYGGTVHELPNTITETGYSS